jgi:RNA polymerase sigma-70 factor (ECF subfamily)
MIPLAEQDRGLWDQALLSEGRQLVRRCLEYDQPGPYQVQAAIQAVHSDADGAAGTDWSQILLLYDQLWVLQPSPVVALHRAVAVAEMDGPAPALAVVDGLALDHYQPYWAIRADLLRRLGRIDDARAAYDRAIALTDNEAERRFLTSRRASL